MTNFLLILIVGGIAYYLLRGKFQRTNSQAQTYGHLPGPGTFDFDIVGEANYQAALEKICGGRTKDSAEYLTEAVLYLEDSNPHDDQAVMVTIDGETVGYLSRQNARSYRKQLKQMGHERIICKCDAMIVGGWHRSASDQGKFGVKLDLP